MTGHKKIIWQDKTQHVMYSKTVSDVSDQDFSMYIVWAHPDQLESTQTYITQTLSNKFPSSLKSSKIQNGSLHKWF